jgi:hypothetical protein
MSVAGLKNVDRGCPICGTRPTTTQYVFYPKFNKLRCRGCRNELKYVFPLWRKIVSGVLSFVVTVAGLVAIMVLELTHGLPFVPWAAAYVLALAILASYAEAGLIQRRYPPSKS